MKGNIVTDKRVWTADQLKGFVQKIADHHDAGRLPFAIHLPGGNEEQLIAIFSQIKPGDYVFSTHRNWYHALLHGLPENEVEEKVCGNLMDVELNVLEIQPDMSGVVNDVIQVNDRISVKLKFPEFSILERANKFESVTDMAFDMIAESVEYIFDGEQYYYAAESEPDDIIEFIESLNQDQFNKIENFFNNLPKLNKSIEVDCKKCGFHHTIQVEGLDSFFA